MVIGGIILLIIAGICYAVARSSSGRLHAMNAADTYSAQLLTDLHGKVTGTLGPEALAETCEVEGVIECDQPLKAPLSGTPCVAYTRTKVREYEEDVTTTDSQGKSVTQAQRSSETLEDEDRRVNFWVRDDTGRVLICPDGAELEWKQTVNRFDEDRRAKLGRTREVGTRHTEQIVPLGIKVYVLGCAVDHQGQPMVGCHPKNKDQHFFISTKSERELASSAASSSRNFYYAAAASGALGAILLLLGLIMG